MAIQETNGNIIIAHATPITLTYVGEDSATGTERFAYADSTLNAEHTLVKRDFGRKVSGSVASRKGKITIVQEKITAAGVRRSMTQSVSLLAHSDFDAAVIEQAIADLGQFLLDNKADLAAGRFDS